MQGKDIEDSKILDMKVLDLERKLVEYEDEKLLDLINTEFRNNQNLNYVNYTRNLKILKLTDDDILITMKARMKIFTENFHSMKHASAVIATLVTILTFIVSEFSFLATVVIFILAILAGMAYGYIVTFSDVKHYHLTAVYFNELIDYILKENKYSNEE